MPVRQLRLLCGRPLQALDALGNRVFGWRGNPLYQSGALVVLAFLVMLATGLYLLLFYRIDDPYGSIRAIQDQALAGRWIRAMHRYAADAAVVAAFVHGLRMFVQGRTTGARRVAWLAGLVLLFVLFVSGWTGYVMLWDEQAQVLSLEGARLLDFLPIFAEPVGRTFVGDAPPPAAFFFLNLFLHVAIPVGAVLVLWVHVSRLARPVLLPPRALLWGCVAALAAASILAPAPLGAEADLRRMVGRIDLDAFYGFWLPLSRALSPGEAWAILALIALTTGCVPWWTRFGRPEAPPSQANQALCTGCLQCALDCPYDAIEMIHVDGGARQVSQVDSARCVSCGICSGSCAPMVVGPPGRTGRDQLEDLRALHTDLVGDVTVLACRSGARGLADAAALDGAPVLPIACGGNVHTSVVEGVLRAGAAGALLAVCPPRDCRGREGPKWLDERLFADREAELRESVDRRRIRVVHAGPGERRRVVRELARFRKDLRSLAASPAAAEIDLVRACESPGGVQS